MHFEIQTILFRRLDKYISSFVPVNGRPNEYYKKDMIWQFSNTNCQLGKMPDIFSYGNFPIHRSVLEHLYQLSINDEKSICIEHFAILSIFVLADHSCLFCVFSPKLKILPFRVFVAGHPY